MAGAEDFHERGGRGEGGLIFHVPQSSRRDKLRIINNPTTNYNNDHESPIITTSSSPSSSPSPHLHHHGLSVPAALPLYEYPSSSLLPTTTTHWLPCATQLGGSPLPVLQHGDHDHDAPQHHHHNNNIRQQTQFGIKEEAHTQHQHQQQQVVNLMGFLGGGGFMINGGGGAPSSSSSPSPSHRHHQHQTYLSDPQPSSFPSNVINPNSSSTVQQLVNHNNNPFLYNTTNTHHHSPLHDHHHNFTRDFDHHNQSFNGGSGDGGCREVVQQGLSLSLSSPHTHRHHHHHPLELNQPRSSYNQQQPSSFMMLEEKTNRGGGGGATTGYTSRGIVGGGVASTSNNFSRGSSHPLGPFTGYTLILKESRFLKPAQQLLEDFCDVGGKGINYVDTTSTSTGDASMDSSPPPPPPPPHPMESLNCYSSTGVIDDKTNASSDQNSEHPSKKTRLISMLDEVYKRYKQYYQQMLAIVASFETVAGLGNASPYTTFALKSLSKHFKCLKNAITDQLRCASKDLGVGRFTKDQHPRFGTTEGQVPSHRPPHKSSIPEHQHVWRPQRGLPERAVAVLRAWLFEHFLHPYPTDTDKQMLAKQTGLSRSQVSNWFINARVRLWKPMVEEIHMLETRQSQKPSELAEQNAAIRLNEPLPTTANPPLSDKHSQANLIHKVQELPLKRIRNEPLHIPDDRSNDQMNFSYTNFSSHQHLGAGVGTTSAGGNSGVSLTLGLRQNNGIGLPEPFPMIAHRFGLEGSNEEYGFGSFEASNRNYGKAIGGQLLHDFVG